MNKFKRLQRLYAVPQDFGGAVEFEQVTPEGEIDLDELLEGVDADEPEAEASDPVAQLAATMDDRFNQLQATMADLKPRPGPVVQEVEEPAQPVAAVLDVATAARQTMQVERDIFDDIAEIYSDAPPGAIRAIRNEMDKFATLDALKDAKSKGWHIQIADSIIGAQIRTGQYGPGKLRAAVEAATTTSSVSASAPQRTVLKVSPTDQVGIGQVNETLTKLGIPALDKDDYALCQRHLKRVGIDAIR
jgi:hypothetical protein